MGGGAATPAREGNDVLNHLERLRKSKEREDHGDYILSKLFDKLHFRRAGTRSSLCGKARAGAPAFEVFDNVPREVAKSVCLRCFKGGDVETPAGKE